MTLFTFVKKSTPTLQKEFNVVERMPLLWNSQKIIIICLECHQIIEYLFKHLTFFFFFCDLKG